MQYPIIDNLIYAYLRNGWTGLDIPETITYEPIQLGSGEPSPDNIRPILPATTLNIGSVDVPVYGGTLEVTTGVLTVDTVLVTCVKSMFDHALNYYQTTDVASSDYPVPYSRVDWNIARQTQKCDKAVIGNPYTETINLYMVVCLATTTQTYGAVRLSESMYDSMTEDDTVSVVYKTELPTTYQLTSDELGNAIGIKNDIAHRLKLPLPHYFPHPVIDALQRAAAGTQTVEDTEVLRHYLTPLGIGGI